MRTTLVSERRFLSAPLPGAAPIVPDHDAPRRIWEVEPGALFIALGVLVDRSELETVFLDAAGEDRRGTREDALLRDAVGLCARPSPFSEAIEQLLDAPTRRIRPGVGGCPMYELAAWWLGVKECAAGEQLAALAWSLARDRRWVVRPLLEMVRDDIWVRALRVLRGRKAHSSGRSAAASPHSRG